MNKFKNFALKHPIFLGLVLIFLFLLLTILTYPAHFLFAEDEFGQLWGDTLSKTIIFGVFLTILWRFGWLPASGIKHLVKIRIWFVIAVIFIYHMLVNLYVFTGDVSFITSHSPLALTNLAYYFSGSLLEEIIFRGLVLLAMVFAWGDSKSGILKAVFLSSLLFGLMHLLNIGRIPVGAVLFQAVGSALLGILWAGLLLSTRSLWPAIILHWLTNAAVNIKLIGIENFQETYIMRLILAILFIPLAAYGIYLVRKLPEDYKNQLMGMKVPSMLKSNDGLGKSLIGTNSLGD